MHFLTWNVKFGRGTDAALDLANQRDVDVLFLQEASGHRGWSGAVHSERVPQRDWGSSILVRYGSLEPVIIPRYTGWLAGARWVRRRTDASEVIYLFSLHSPTSSKGERRNSYVTESQRIIDAICAEVAVGAPLVIGGDFNFRSFGERLENEHPVNHKSELAALARFRELGFSVAWRDANPGLGLPQTLRWSRAPLTPYHCDGFLLRGFDPAAIQCDVLSSDVVFKQSDHSPVALRLDVSTSA